MDEACGFNLRAQGVIPVAILSSASFDATTVDANTACFGDAGDESQRDCTARAHVEDANGDGRLDLVLQFKTQQTGIDPGDIQACLNAKTFDGVRVEGCDTIQTL